MAVDSDTTPVHLSTLYTSSIFQQFQIQTNQERQAGLIITHFILDWIYTHTRHTHQNLLCLHEYYSNLHIHLAIKLACMLLLIFVTSDYRRHPILCYTPSLFHYLREVQPTMTPCDLSEHAIASFLLYTIIPPHLP